MIRLLSSMVALAGGAIAAFGQPETLGWILNHPTPSYALSGDETRLAFYDLRPDETNVWAKVLDLKTWEWGITPTLGTMRLTGDKKSGYQLWLGMDGRKAEGEWVGYKKFVTNFYTDVAGPGMKRTQWPDQHLVLASMPDGTLLAADKVSFQVSKTGYWQAKMRGLKIVSLPAGTVVRTLRPDLALEVNVDDLAKKGTVTPDGRWLIWWAYGDWFDAIPLEGGETRRIAAPHAGIQGYAGQYLVSVGRLDSFQGFRDNRKTVIDLATGKPVYDAIVAKNTPFHLWATTSRDGSIFTFDEVTRELLEETVKGGALERVSARTLEGEDLSLSSEYWGKRSVLIVSKPTDKVLLLPNRYSDGQVQNEAYVWQLSTGKLLYRSPNLIRPHPAYLAKLNAPPPPPPAAAVAIGPNMLVQTGGRLYHLRELSYSKQWVAFALTKNRHGFFEREDATKPEQFFAPGNTRVVSTTACPACAGGGAQKVTELRTTQTEAKMIYNTIVTTKTGTVQSSQACDTCKGSGFQF